MYACLAFVEIHTLCDFVQAICLCVVVYDKVNVEVIDMMASILALTCHLSRTKRDHYSFEGDVL